MGAVRVHGGEGWGALLVAGGVRDLPEGDIHSEGKRASDLFPALTFYSQVGGSEF